MTYALVGERIIDVQAGTIVAVVPDGAQLEHAVRLVGLANLGVRDEALLDQLGEQITSRNDP